MDTLPHPGAYWPPAKREQWLDTARNIFALIYEEMEEERPPVRLVEPPRETGHNEQRFAG
ncbi:MAG TPA: hypothetical protein VFX28_02645 [Methylomirabilota bacterium]|nr:hypothetical protein [Methylomirabilota bacterium]